MKKICIVTNSDTANYEINRRDDGARPYLESNIRENVEFAKRCYQNIQREINQGYHCPGITHEECQAKISYAEKKLKKLK